MNIPLTRDKIMDLETGQVTRQGERISIEFWDPQNEMNRCIIDNAGRYTPAQLFNLAAYQRDELGRTEIKMRRE